MRKLFLLSALLVAGITLGGSQAMAFNTRITVYASVAEMRYIYVNKDGFITKVGGNTPQNIEPQVINEANQVISMTDAINQQYQRFLNDHHGKLQASKIYDVNPVSVDTVVNAQSIKVESSQAQLTLSL